MALGDYILCCKCDVKLLYDGAEENRKWWKERFGSEPEIMCPDCQKEKREWVGLTDEEMFMNCPNWLTQEHCKTWLQQIEAKLKAKNGFSQTEKNT